MRFSTLLALPFVVTGALAQGIARDFNIEGCVGVTAVLNPALGLGASLLTGLFTTESACAVSIPLYIRIKPVSTRSELTEAERM